MVTRLLEKQPGTQRLLLIADQWEELYTLTQEEAGRRRFIDELLATTSMAKVPLSVVLTLRGDFVGKTLAYRPLSDRLQGAQINLGPMSHDELNVAVQSPAKKLGLHFEAGLVKTILEDVSDEPGNLPLLEFVLKRLWEDRQGTMLHHEAYEAMGGLQGAVAKKADEVFDKLTPLEQQTVHRIFLQIVRPNDSGEDTRRRASVDEIGEAAWTVVKKLADERLVVTSTTGVSAEETVEVAHEALIHNWSRLKIWLDQDREFLLWRERLRLMLTEYQRAQRDEGALLRGPLLAEAKRWQAERIEQLTIDERDYIATSQNRGEEEQRQEEERQRRELEQVQKLAEEQRQRAEAQQQRIAAQTRATQRMRIMLGVLLLTIAGLIWLALSAEKQNQIALSRLLTNQALNHLPIGVGDERGKDFAHGLLLAVHAVNTEPLLEAQNLLLKFLQATPLGPG